MFALLPALTAWLPILTTAVIGLVATVSVLLIAAKVFGKKAVVGPIATVAHRAIRWAHYATLPWRRFRKTYAVVPTCHIPAFNSLDAILRFVVGYKTDGVFVELGAFDGESFSNTAGLADVGWTGHYVEAMPHFAAMCRARHSGNKGVTVHEVAVGAEETTLNFSSAGPLSTSVDSSRDIVSSSDHPARATLDLLGWVIEPKNDVQVQCRNVNALLADMGVPKDFDVLVIDIEGMERTVLAAWDFAKFRPKVMIVELNLYYKYRQGAVWEETKDIERIFRENGYFILHRDWINTVFVDERIKTKAERY